MHELVIIETGHIDARFKHEICYHIMDHDWLCEPAILAPTFTLKKVYTFDDDNV